MDGRVLNPPVVSPMFLLDNSNVNKAIETQFKDPTKYSYLEAETILTSIYETTTGIYNHLDVNYNPLASVAVHPSERYLKSSGLYATVKRYTDRGIKDRFDLNIVEYLNLPREMQRILTLVSLDIIAEMKAASKKPNQ